MRVISVMQTDAPSALIQLKWIYITQFSYDIIVNFHRGISQLTMSSNCIEEKFLLDSFFTDSKERIKDPELFLT